jgi:hypothetical protein
LAPFFVGPVLSWRERYVQKYMFFRVVYHGVKSSFFGIGILLVSDLLGGWYFWLVLLGV